MSRGGSQFSVMNSIWATLWMLARLRFRHLCLTFVIGSPHVVRYPRQITRPDIDLIRNNFPLSYGLVAFPKCILNISDATSGLAAISSGIMSCPLPMLITSVKEKFCAPFPIFFVTNFTMNFKHFLPNTLYIFIYLNVAFS